MARQTTSATRETRTTKKRKKTELMKLQQQQEKEEKVYMASESLIESEYWINNENRVFKL